MVIVSPGGAGGHGGMASVTNIIAAWFRQAQPMRPMAVLDARGGGHAMLWPAFFAVAVLRLLVLRASGQAKILHLQVSERSSFVRKGVLGLLGRWLGMTVVLHHHGAELIPFFQTASAPIRRWTRFVTELADLNLVLGARWQAFLELEVGVRPSRVVVLPNAVTDPSVAGLLAHARATRDSEISAPFTFLYLARLTPRKGTDQFVAAMRILHEAGVSVRAILAGNGDVARYAELARKFGLEDVCNFIGWVGRDQVGTLLKSTHALILPSFEEGLPMAVLEALSYGLPVVTTPVGSIPEFLTDGVDCLLVPPGDGVRLASAMHQLVEDPGLRRTLSKNGRALYERSFTVNAFMTGLLEAYDRAQCKSHRHFKEPKL